MEASVGQNTTKDIPANEQIQVPQRRSFSLITTVVKLRDMYKVTQKKTIHSILQLKSVVGVQFYFFTGVSELEFRARSI